jgi:crossover junction endodeoxyribonuclease RusA
MTQHMLTIPVPPTVNHAYGSHGNRRYLKPEGKVFREQVAWTVKQAKLTKLVGRLWISIRIFPKDRRVSDLDNRIKSCQDALMHAGLFDDDSQIDHLEIKRGQVVQGGRCEVLIGEIEQK